MDIRPIRNDADHAAALQAIDSLMDQDPAPGTAAFDRMEVLSILVEEYEARAHPIKAPDPVEAIKVRMAEKHLSQRMLGRLACIGENRISEVLGYRRPLGIAMIRALGPVLDLPIALLAQPYPTTERQPVEA